MILTQGHLVKLKVNEKMENKSVSDLDIFYGNYKDLTFLIHKMIAYDLRVCHDFDLMSFGQVQGYCRKKVIVGVRSIFFMEKHLKFLHYINFTFQKENT